METNISLQLAPPAAKEPPFLRQNWKRVLASTDEWGLKYVRVIDGVANITNGYVMLRCPVDMPNGFYTLNHDNALRKVRPRTNYTSKQYPDVEVLRPNFNELAPFARLTMVNIRALIDYAERARIDEDTLCIDSGGIFMTGNPKDPGFKCHFQGIDEILVRPCQLKLALIEMLRYDYVNLFKEDKTGDTPLVLGHNWQSCALLRPISV